MENNIYAKQLLNTKKCLETEIQKHIHEDVDINRDSLIYCFRRLTFINRQLNTILRYSQNVFKEKINN